MQVPAAQRRFGFLMNWESGKPPRVAGESAVPAVAPRTPVGTDTTLLAAAASFTTDGKGSGACAATASGEDPFTASSTAVSDIKTAGDAAAPGADTGSTETFSESASGGFAKGV